MALCHIPCETDFGSNLTEVEQNEGQRRKEPVFSGVVRQSYSTSTMSLGVRRQGE